jgi:hypothetical protein
MAEITIAGIMRAGAYSPNHIGNDAAIFNATAEHLRRQGCIVNIYSEEQLIAGEVKEPIIVNMCREQQSIALLQQMEKGERIVVNSGFGIENCTRERMTRLLLDNNIPHPESLIVNTDDTIQEALKKHNFAQCWIKRGDFHAMHKEDVSYARHPEEVQGLLHEFALRGISRAVINKHLEGDLVKFYGVQDTTFFYWFYPFDLGHSKYGHEEINGKSQGLKFDVDKLYQICQNSSKVLNVMIYGGDCIISPDGEIRIIDFNDWPSFAPCRDDAAPHIAQCILNHINNCK